MNRRKKVLIITGVLISFLLVVGIFNKDYLLKAFQSTINYLRLNSDRQELYNQLQVTEVQVKTRTTGTEPFNDASASDLDGNDISATDNIVRTLDEVDYVLEVAVNSNVKDNSEIDTSLTGGVIKVKATLPNQGDNPNLTWQEDAWMSNVNYNEDKTEITAEYVVSDTISLFNAVQMLSFGVSIGGYKTEVTSDMLPVFEVWMEGNYNDNPSSSAQSIVVKDTSEPFTISGTPSYNVTLESEYGTLLKSIKEINGTEYEGRYYNIPISVGLAKLDGMTDFRGVEYPSGDFSITLDLTYRYKLEGSSYYTDITSSTTDAIDILNGTTIQAYDVNGQLNDNFYPNTTDTATGDRIPYGKLSLGTTKNSVVDSGVVEASLESNKLIVTFKDYQIGDTFPTLPSSKTSIDYFDSSYNYFLSGIVEVFLPFYGTSDTKNNYYLIVKANSATYDKTDGTTGTIDPGSSTIADADSSDNINNISFTNYLTGTYTSGMYTYDYSFEMLETSAGYGDASRMIGESIILQSFSGMADGDFEGGITNLITWNADIFELTTYRDASYWLFTNTKYSLDYSADNISISFGIYTSDAATGLTTIDQMNDATYDDFTWYSTYSEASANGKVTAIWIDDPDMLGNSAYRIYYNQFKVLDDKESINKTGYFVRKFYAYQDKERTLYRNFFNTYSPTTYDADGNITNYENKWTDGKTVLITDSRTSISMTHSQGGVQSTSYDIQDGNISFEITPSLLAAATENEIIKDTFVYVTLPKGLKYVESSSNKTPESIVENDDGTTLITYLYQDWVAGEAAPEYEKITFETEISSETMNNAIHTVKAVIDTGTDSRDETLYRSATADIRIINLSGTQLTQNIDKTNVDKGEIVTNTIKISNSGTSVLNDVRTTEILPQTGTDLNGEYTITITSLSSNQKMYYSTSDIDSLGLEYSNNCYTSQNVDLTTSSWIEVKTGDIIPSGATVIISQFDTINIGDTSSFSYQINTIDGNGSDTYDIKTYLSSDNTNIILKNNSLSFVVNNRIIEGSVLAANSDVAIPEKINVYLLDEEKNIVETTTTNSDNKYSFDNLFNKNYYVQFEIPINYEVSNSLTNKADSSGLTTLITAENYNANYTVENLDMVLDLKTATITVHHYIKGTTTKLADDVVTTQKYTTTYTTSPATVDSNYELVETPSNATGTVSGNITVTYYYQLKKGTITVHHYIKDTTTKLADDVVTTQDYTTKYTTSAAIVDSNYELVETPSNASGTVSGNITVTYYYQLKKGTITVHHYIKGTTTKLADDVVTTQDYTTKYTTSAATVDSNYELVETPNNANGTVSGNVTVTYYYQLKKGTITVHHYIKDTTTKLADDVVTTQDYTTTYTTSAASVNTNYELVETPSNANGTVSGNVTVTYYYQLKTATLTVHYYLEGTTTELSKTITKTMNWGEEYTTSKASDISANYELVSTPTNATGTIAGDVTVNYYYRLKEGTLITHHYIKGTTTKLSDSVTKSVHWGDSYTTTQATDINENYELVETPSNANGTISADETIVIYYYQLKTATLTVNHYIEGTTDKLSDTVTKTMNWGETYTTTQATDINENYELVETPSNATGLIKGDVTVNYYYRLKEAIVTTNYYIEGTTTKLADSVIQELNWGDKYTTSPSDDVSNNYELISTPSNATGTIKDNSIVVNYYYRLKEATLTVHHYIEGTTDKLADSETSTVYWGDNYTTDSSSKVSTNYELVSTPTNATGTVSGDITVIYYYRLKTATITVYHYIEGTTTRLSDSVTITKKYTEEYTTNPATDIDTNYELVSIPSNASGTVDGNKTVIYYYKLKTATLTVHHYIEGTTTSLVADEINTVTYTHTYKTSPSTNISTNYELASTQGTLEGTVSGNVEVTYYYKLKSATLTVKHLEYGTNIVLAPEEIKTLKYTDEYETTISSKIPGNYEYYSKTDNYKGIVSTDNIEVIYYYQKKDSQLSSSITLTAPTEITSKNEKVNYKLEYTSTISDYKGSGTITILVKLPYHIDDSKSELNSGLYNSDLKTITWTINESEIDASKETKELTIIKEFSVVFSDLISTDRVVSTSAESNIELENNNRSSEDTKITYIKIPSKIIVHHYIEGTKTKIADDIETTNLIGETYVSSAIEKDGYILKKEPENKNHIYQEETTEVIYEYERITFKITTKVDGGNGTINGNETVFYGENSTEGNIVIKPSEGYQVSHIIINGEEKNINQCKYGCTLNNFIEVHEDKEIIVVFEVIPDNPNTSSIITIFTITGLIILSTGAFVIIRKNKPSIKKI